MLRTYHWNSSQIGTVLDVFVSEDEGLLCTNMESVVTVAWNCMEMKKPSNYTTGTGHVHRQNSLHKLKEWIVFLQMEEPQSPRPGHEHPGLCIRRLDCVSSRNHTATTTRPIAHRPARFRQIPPCGASEDRLLSGHHQCTGKTHQNRMKCEQVKDVGGRTSHEPNMISKEFTTVQRSEPNVHDVDGALVCGRQSNRKFGKGSQTSTWSSPPDSEWLEKLEFGSNGVRFGTYAGTKVTTALQQIFELFKIIAQDQLRTTSSSTT